MSLRRSLTAILVGLTAFAFVAALAVVQLAGYLRRTATEVTDSLHSIRLIQQLEIDLLVHARSTDQALRANIQSEMERDLKIAQQYVDGENEQHSLDRAQSSTAAYFRRAAQVGFREAEDLRELTEAGDALRELLDINTAEANRAESEAIRWNDFINGAVPFIAGAMVLAVVLVLVWLWRVAFQPLLNIGEVMASFAAGQRLARASEQGPDELRLIASQFNQMAEALQRQYENQLVFVTGVAHDLRNPLSPLKMSTAILGSEGPLPPEDRIRAMMAMMARQVDRLDRMIGDLLDKARIEAGQLELRTELLDGRLLARTTFDLFENSSPNHKLEIELPDVPVPIQCDELRMEQVLNNLVSNAIKYSPGGGRIRIAVAAESGEAVFRVSDEGVGIRTEDIQYVFEPFRRVRSSGIDVPGIGLGLSIARRIVESHNGRIEVHSQPGKGTTFEVHIPLTDHRVITRIA